MKKISYLASFLLFYLISCKNEEEVKSENDIDAVRNFVQAALEGNYEKARGFMLADSINLDRMKMIEALNLSPEERRGLATASINVHEIKRVNDSTTIVIYSNSCKNNWDTLRALKRKEQWLVDFNYLFEHDMDTLVNKTDSLKND
jgi:hypothetical protein